MTPNVQEFGRRLTQVYTPHEGYEHFVIDSTAHTIPAILKYTEHFQNNWKRLSYG